MPTLGFLKKKRAKDGKEGHGDNPPSTPTSPVASSAHQSSGSASHPSAESFPIPPTTAPHGAAQSPSSSKQASKPSNTSNTSAAPAAPDNSQMAHMATAQPAQPPHQASPSAHERQNLPSISNLINPTQQSTQSQQQQHGAPSQQQSAQYLTEPDTRSALTVSPGTDPDRLAQEQAKAGMTAPGQLLPTQGDQSGEGVQGQPIPTGGVIDAAAQQPAGQVRVTKGKYSLQDFEILRTLGTGSFGRVHLVQSRHNTRFYAIKVLKKAQVVKMKQVEHTNDERRMLAEVKHPFLITLWGTFQDSKNLYMVMDFVEGGELFSLLRKSGVN